MASRPENSGAGSGGGCGPQEPPGGSSCVIEPQGLMCPITQMMYRDPCFVPESGNTYERRALEQYWSSLSRPRDPLTNMDLQSPSLHPNWGIRREVQKFLQDHPGYTPQGWPDREVPVVHQRREPRGWEAAWSRACGLTTSPHSRAVMCGVVVVALAAAWLLASRNGSAHFGLPPDTALQPPKGSLVQAWADNHRLLVVLPSKGVWGIDSHSVGQLCFAIYWTGFTGVWTFGALCGGAPVAFAMFSLPFWGVGAYLLVSTLKPPWQSELLDLGREDYVLSKAWLGFGFSKHTGLIADLGGLPPLACDGNRCELVLEDGTQEYSFGSSLRRAEAKWLQAAMKKHLVNVEGGERFSVDPRERRLSPQQSGQVEFVIR